MAKFAIFLVSCVFALACSGDAGELFPEPEEDAGFIDLSGESSAVVDREGITEVAFRAGDDRSGPLELPVLGVAEQPYTAKVTGSYQFGTQTGSNKMQCDRTTSNQVCSIPRRKKIQLAWAHPDLQDTAEAAALNLDSNLDSGWQITSSPSSGPLASDQVRVLLQKDSCLGNKTNNIEGYSCVGYGSVFSLSEGSGVVGQYQEHGGCIAGIDLDDIAAKYSSSGDRFRLEYHAVGHAALACIGLGSRDGAGNTFSKRSILPSTATKSGLSAGEKCRANSFFVASDGTFSLPPFGGLCSTAE